MGVRKLRDAERTRRRILDVACDLFGRKGYKGANMREIAGFAKIRAATVYHYFPSKKAILLDLFETFYRELDELYEAVDAALPVGIPLGDALIVFMERHRAFVARRRDFTYLFFSEGVKPGATVNRRMKSLVQAPAGKLEKLAARWPDIPQEETLTLFMSIVGMNVFSEVGGRYMARAMGISLSAEEQTRALASLFGGRYGDGSG
jgi:AcrR family transcriptional regulator